MHINYFDMNRGKKSLVMIFAINSKHLMCYIALALQKYYCEVTIRLHLHCSLLPKKLMQVKQSGVLQCFICIINYQPFLCKKSSCTKRIHLQSSFLHTAFCAKMANNANEVQQDSTPCFTCISFSRRLQCRHSLREIYLNELLQVVLDPISRFFLIAKWNRNNFSIFIWMFLCSIG